MSINQSGPKVKKAPARDLAARPVINGPGKPQVLTLKEAAAYLRVSEDDVLRMVREQGLHARQVGSEWRFSERALEDWLRSGPQLKGRAAHPANEALLALLNDPDYDPAEGGWEKLRQEIARQNKELARGERQ
jgi:excisionase family DNA binding protein